MSPSLATGKTGAAPKGAALNTATVRPAQVSTVQRFVPHYLGEPVAGHAQGLKNPDGSWVAPGGKFQPGAHLALRPYYTDAYTTHHGAGPSGQESTQWNAAQVSLAHQLQVQNYGLPGYLLRSLLPGGLDEGGAKTPAQAVKAGVDVGSYLVPVGGPAVKAAGILGLGGKALRSAGILKGVAEEAPAAAHTSEAAAAVRTGLKGAPTVRAGQAAGFSEQRGSRFARVEAIYRDTSLTPEEREAKARAVLKGQLERPVYMGFKKLDLETVTNLRSQIMAHDTLRTGQKTTLLNSLTRATKGIVPTAGEQKLFEQVFGKDISGGINQAAKSGRWGRIATTFVNAPRTIQATFDMSAFLRQGFVALGRHPIITSKNFVPMVKAFGSEGYTRQIEHQIETHPNFPLMQAAKVAFTGGDAISPHEEQFAAHMLEAIGGAKNPIRWSSRSYSTFLNKTRADIFNHMLEVAQAQGRNVHDEQFLRDLGEMVNVFTGRGRLPGDWERGATLFNGIFFSPRLMASRVRMLTQPFNVSLARRNPFIYRQYLRAGLQSFGGLATMLALAKLNGLDVGTNPRSADFGKIKLGNTSVDLGAGFLQYFHVLGEGILRQYKSSATGKVSDLGVGPGKRSYASVLGDFLTGKLSPVASFGLDVLNQSTGFGPFNPAQEAYSHLTPLSWQDVYDIYKQHGGGLKRIPPAVAGGVLSIFGGGMQTYPRGPKKVIPAGGSGGGNDPYFGGSGGGGGSDPYFNP